MELGELDELHEGVSQGLSNDQSLEGEGRQNSLPMTQDSLDAAEQQRRMVAMRMGSLAVAGHHAASDIEEHFPQAAQYIQDAAAGLEHISHLLRDPHLDEIAALIGNIRRKQPAAIMAGIALASLGLIWLLKSSVDTMGGVGVGASGGDREGTSYGIH
jgi:hypothetical protein